MHGFAVVGPTAPVSVRSIHIKYAAIYLRLFVHTKITLTVLKGNLVHDHTGRSAFRV